MNIKILFALLAIITTSQCVLVAQQIDYKGFSEWSWHKEGITEYYLYTPSEVEEGKQYPIVIHLHGCCGQDDHATLRNAVDPPVRMWHNFGHNTQLEPTYIVAPKTTRGWQQKFPDIKKVVDDLIEEGTVDRQRIYMVGFSMGGGGIYQFIEEYPGYIAAAIPMGMSMKTEPEFIKDIPVWAIRGELDYHARALPDDIGEVRALNGDRRGDLDWVTGVNPRFTSFEGVGHGVQWDAVSRLDLLPWIYSKINDGNVYPVVFFEEPEHLQAFHPGQIVKVEVNASDPDGSITKLELYHNGKLISTLTKKPYTGQFVINKGNTKIDAIAYDDKGKSSTAEMIVMGICLPKILTTKFPKAIQGDYYYTELKAEGNGPFSFEAIPPADLPLGLTMNINGVLSGMPENSGNYIINVKVKDINTREVEYRYDLYIKRKYNNEVIISNVHSTADSLEFKVDKMRMGALPNTQAGTEVFFSKLSEYEDLTYISTSQFAKDAKDDEILFFTVDEDVTVLVAYEIHDNLFESTIPDWLKEFKKLDNEQIVAQYFYFEVYSKDFPAGNIILPGADAASNGALRNYFVMVKKR